MQPTISKKQINDFNFDAVRRSSAGIAAAYAANGAGQHGSHVEVVNTSREKAVAIGGASSNTVPLQSDVQDGNHHDHDMENADADALYALAVAGDCKKKYELQWQWKVWRAVPRN